MLKMLFATGEWWNVKIKLINLPNLTSPPSVLSSHGFAFADPITVNPTHPIFYVLSLPGCEKWKKHFWHFAFCFFTCCTGPPNKQTKCFLNFKFTAAISICDYFYSWFLKHYLGIQPSICMQSNCQTERSIRIQKQWKNTAAKTA